MIVFIAGKDRMLQVTYFGGFEASSQNKDGKMHVELESKDVMSHILVRRIISGGQTGADQAGLDVALAFGIAHGGWVPKGRKTEIGPLSPKYSMWEMDSEDYAERTKKNVLASDGTLIVSHGELTGGSLLTLNLANRHKRHVIHLNLGKISIEKAIKDLAGWLELEKIRVLNVAGPRASSDPDIYGVVKELLKGVLLPLSAAE